MFISLNGEIVLPHIQVFETELQGLSVDSVFIDWLNKIMRTYYVSGTNLAVGNTALNLSPCLHEGTL